MSIVTISNFRNVKRIRDNNYQTLFAVSADVDVTTTSGCMWWKTETTVTKQVFLGATKVNWIWVDTGRWTPGFDVETLYKAYRAQELLNM